MTAPARASKVWFGVAALLVAGQLAVHAESPLAPGAALAFQATDLAGRPFDARSLSGQPVLLDFWAVWCAPCLASFPELDRLHREGLQVLGVAVHSGTVEDVAPIARRHPVSYPVVVGDADLADRFGVVGFPTYVLVNAEGSVHDVYVGKLEDLLKERLATDIAALRKPSAGAGAASPRRRPDRHEEGRR